MANSSLQTMMHIFCSHKQRQGKFICVAHYISEATQSALQGIQKKNGENDQNHLGNQAK